MDAGPHYRLDPRLRKASGKGRVQVFIEVAHAAAANWLRRQRGIRELVHVVDGYYTATLEAGSAERLAAHEGIIEVERVRYLRPTLIRSLESIHGREPPPWGGAVPDGKGVVIGFVDYGLDFKQKDFQGPGGRTRIAYLWDHDLRREGRERAPKKYRYGVEYSSRDIDRGRIRHCPLNEDRRVSGHGTLVAGIAAGNGHSADRKYKAGKYAGVAPGATLVFVSLKRRDVLAQVGAAGGTIANSVKLAHGIAYCFEKADELGMPCVVNLSLGFNGGGHDGNMAVEWIIDGLLRKPGRAVVVAAGNEDEPGLSVYATGRLKPGQQTTLDWEIGIADAADPADDPTTNEMEVWYSRGSALEVWLEDPVGKPSRRVLPGKRLRHPFPEGEELAIDSDLSTPWAGSARLHIELDKGAREGIRAGTWKVKLRAVRVAPGEPRRRVRFHAWIEREAVPRPEHSRFARKHRNPRTAITLTTPSTARQAITVACHKNNASPKPGISFFSGRGPTRDGREKPELAAPGDWVFSTHALAGKLVRNGEVRPARKEAQGTSLAAPHVAGVVARLLSRNGYLTAEEIRNILILSASRKRWHPKWGYGRLDAARALELLEQLHGSGRTPAG